MNWASVVLGVAIPLALYAQTTPPDFSGVYYPVNPFGNFRGGPSAGAPRAPQAVPARPKISAPLADGSQGRRPMNRPSGPNIWRNGR